MKYTKGNWEYEPTITKDKNGNPLYYLVCLNSQHFVNVMVNKYLNINIDEAKANAKLIAAAPDLLEACNIAKELIETRNKINLSDTTWNSVHKKLAEAYKKATE